jgi:hypothetical protein
MSKRSNLARPVLLGATLLLAGIAAQSEASAQTAKDVNCKGCVGKRDLGKKAVGKKHLGKNSIRARHIKAGQVKASHLGNAAKPAGVSASESPQVAQIGDDDEILETVTVEAPGPGVVVATGNLSVSFAANSSALCAVTTENAIATPFVSASAGSSSQSLPISTTRAFPVSAAGAVTVNLLCRMTVGVGNYPYPALTALFVPTTY